VNFWALQHAVRQGSASKVMELLNLGSPGNVRAIRHPLGFYCLPVHRGTADRFGVCVHLWSPDVRPDITTSNVHCHSWDLLSFVLYGAVHNQRHDLVETTDGPWRLYDAVTEAGADQLIATASLVDLKSHEPEAYLAGEYYELPAGRFHSSAASAVESATVVLGTDRPGERNAVLGDPTGPDQYPRGPRPICSAAETASLVDGLLSRVG
jgi:hypothetical protein